MTSRLRIVTFPRDDADFARAVDDKFSVVESLDGTPAEKVVHLLQELLGDYPKLEIRQQDSLASFDSEPMTWYAYRDGLTVN
jgi:hypothetical protein